MSRRPAIDFLLGRIDYERGVAVPYGEPQYRLDRMRELLERLGRPDREYLIVHVAGTKGKGSTSAMIAAGLSACGHKTGLFTSPHLERIEERIVVDGRMIDERQFDDLVERLRPTVARMDEELLRRDPPQSGPTYFELTTAMALMHFADCGAAAAVLEVGLGGRLDSTNVCQSSVSVITSISFDHTKQLGNTLAEIAWEKAGIIKPGVPVVSGVTDDEARAVVERTAVERGSRLVQLGRDFDFAYRAPRNLQDSPAFAEFDIHWRGAPARTGVRGVELTLPGRHQAANGAVALAALDEVRRLARPLDEVDIRRGLRELQWPGRVEVVHRRPCIVLDSAHNGASVRALVETLDESFAARRRWLIFATTQEKDVAGMLAAVLPKFDRVVFTRYGQNPRAVPVEELRAAAEVSGYRNWELAADPAAAWTAVGALRPQPDDLICVAGSFHIAGQMRRIIDRAGPFGRPRMG